MAAHVVGIGIGPSRPDGSGEWPECGVDFRSAVSAGWTPTPISEYVVKLSSRCNLACDYCYVYAKADQSWRDQPAVMSPGTLDQLARRIGDHAAEHALDAVRVVLHGGEPLLAGRDLIEHAVRTIRRALPAPVRLELRMQTNGVLLDADLLELLHRHGIRVGVSLDGSPTQHDRQRKYADGRGSHPATARALRLLASPEHRAVFAGILCTVDLGNDPLEAYAALLEFDPPTIDFLLPHGTWSAPPPGVDPRTGTPYADWLGAVFDEWYLSAHTQVRIRLFEEIIGLALGGRSRSDQVGLSPAAFVVIDTDGSIQQTDSLKAAYAGAVGTGLHVATSAIGAVLEHPAVIARQLGLAALADTCRRCAIVSICGGGHYAHRHRAGDGFRNPSVYCADLTSLISHVLGRLGSSLRT